MASKDASNTPANPEQTGEQSTQQNWRNQSTLFDVDGIKWRFKGKAAVRARKIQFLDTYAKLGNVLYACMATQIDRTLPYVWMERDPEFKKAYEYADMEHCDRIRNAVFQRGIIGWDEPVVFKGQIAKDPQTGRPVVVRKFSDRMLELAAKAKCPEFRDKIEHSGKVEGTGVLLVPAAMTAEEWSKVAKEQQRELAERKKSIG